MSAAPAVELTPTGDRGDLAPMDAEVLEARVVQAVERGGRAPLAPPAAERAQKLWGFVRRALRGAVLRVMAHRLNSLGRVGHGGRVPPSRVRRRGRGRGNAGRPAWKRSWSAWKRPVVSMVRALWRGRGAGGILGRTLGATPARRPWERRADGCGRGHARHSDDGRTGGGAGRRAAGAPALKEDQGPARLPGRDPAAAAPGAALRAALGGARRPARRAALVPQQAACPGGRAGRNAAHPGGPGDRDLLARGRRLRRLGAARPCGPAARRRARRAPAGRRRGDRGRFPGRTRPAVATRLPGLAPRRAGGRAPALRGGARRSGGAALAQRARDRV